MKELDEIIRSLSPARQGLIASLARTHAKISRKKGKRRRNARKALEHAAENQEIARWLVEHGLEDLGPMILYPKKGW